MSKISCVVEYFYSPHLSQVYKGFQILEKRGVIKLKFITKKVNTNKPIINVFINDKHHVIYDMLDGFNWVDEYTLDENLKFFKNNLNCDFYFKRSFNNLLNLNNNKTRRIFPLGFNYQVNFKEVNFNLNRFIKKIYYNFFPSVYGIPDYKEFEHYPVSSQNPKILFSARLWDPKDVVNPTLKEEREFLNNFRIECIRKCKKEFKEYFTGGLQSTPLANEIAKDLVLSNSQTDKFTYINSIKNHDICINTLGLHKSNGWKLSEYIVASRFIISEPLFFDNSNFKVDENYLQFSNVDELLNCINRVLNDRDLKYNIMLNNFNYYNSYLRPDILVLNTILSVLKFS